MVEQKKNKGVVRQENRQADMRLVRLRERWVSWLFVGFSGPFGGN